MMDDFDCMIECYEEFGVYFFGFEWDIDVMLNVVC